jgi:hypothetical protein
MHTAASLSTSPIFEQLQEPGCGNARNIRPAGLPIKVVPWQSGFLPSRDAGRYRERKAMAKTKRTLRSKAWFDDAERPDQTALYLERYLNFALNAGELRDGRPK